MDENTVLITVVVPCFNNAVTIEETINSVLCQTFRQWELICVDDGSTDETVEIIRRFCKKDKRVKLLIRDCEPKGGSHCRNIGAREGNGEYLIFLDGDDLLLSTCLEKRYDTIQATDCDFVVFPMKKFKDNDTTKLVNGTPLVKNRDYLYYFASCNAGWQTTSTIIRKHFFEKINGFDVNFMRSQDIEMNLRAIAASNGNYKIKYDEECDFLLRIGVHTSSSLTTKIENALASYPSFLGLLNLLEKQSVFKDFSKLSKARLCIYCNCFIMYDLLSNSHSNSDYAILRSMNKRQMGLLGKDYILFYLLYCTRFLPSINYLFSRLISKIIRISFD